MTRVIDTEDAEDADGIEGIEGVEGDKNNFSDGAMISGLRGPLGMSVGKKFINWRTTQKVDNRLQVLSWDDASRKSELVLRKIYAPFLLIIVIGQIIFSDCIIYQIFNNNHWEMNAKIFITFLSTIIIEIVGLVAVVTRSLFPQRSPEPPPSM